jgi:2-amino-4-hydroxy-6-hydroxymethyldihydropteridine diphosphokinase
LKTAFLSLGSNLGDRRAYLQAAVERLSQTGVRLVRESSVYETDPQDLPDQPKFLNMVVEIETALFPLQLLSCAQKIERELGRQRLTEKGPRTIDIDILFYGRFVIETDRLRIPHARLEQRRFVLEPLAELAPHFRHPVHGTSINQLLRGVAGQGVRRWDP